MAFQGNIPLFYRRGELQRLEPYLNTEQRLVFEAVCNRINAAIETAQHTREEADRQEIVSILRDVYRSLTAGADKLDIRGNAVKFIGQNLLMGNGEE